MKPLLTTLLLAALLTGCSGLNHNLYQGSDKARIQSFDTVLINYIDDENMGVGFIGQKHTYDIKPGQHVLLVEYSDIFDIDADQHEKVVSRPAKITFMAEAGKQYQVQHPPQKRLNNAKAFAKKPEFWIVELPSGERMPSAMELSRPRTFMDGLKFDGKPEYEFASDAVNPAPEPAPTPATAPVAAPGQSRLKSLQDTWRNASEQERASFLHWIKQP